MYCIMSQTATVTGTDVVATVESSIVSGKATIRHTGCELLLHSNSQQQVRCSTCQAHRKSLYVLLNRLITSSTKSDVPPTDVSSHTNYRYLSGVCRTSRMRNLHRRYLLEKKKALRLKKKVQDLIVKKGVEVNKETDQDLRRIMKDSFTIISKKYPENSFRRIFWQQHSQAASLKNQRGVRWHPAMIRWCLYLRHLSGKAYETLRNTGSYRPK